MAASAISCGVPSWATRPCSMIAAWSAMPEGGLGELLDDDDGHAAGGDRRHQLVEVGHDDGGQAHGDLVEQQHLGLPGQRARDGQHLLLAPRERAGQLPAALLEPGELLVGAGLDLGRA